MYEHRTEPLLPRPVFILRVLRHGALAFSLIAFSLLLGMTGYHVLEKLSWLDAFLNSAMLLGGMGPVNPLGTSAGKLFAGLYALNSGLVFITVAGVVSAPVLHRLLHRFHLDTEDDEGDSGKPRKSAVQGRRKTRKG